MDEDIYLSIYRNPIPFPVTQASQPDRQPSQPSQPANPANPANPALLPAARLPLGGGVVSYGAFRGFSRGTRWDPGLLTKSWTR